MPQLYKIILFSVKVAVQVVNYYSQAFNALKQSVSEEAVGTKIYTVNIYIILLL